MTRIAAREIAVQAVYSLDFAQDAAETLESRLDPAFYEDMACEDELYGQPPDEAQGAYIRRIVEGVDAHLAELDGYIERYAVGWKFGRLPRVAIAVMRVCMFELLYMHDVPVAASVNAAVEISRKYEPEEVTAFVNGILGTFSRSESLRGGQIIPPKPEPSGAEGG